MEVCWQLKRSVMRDALRPYKGAAYSAPSPCFLLLFCLGGGVASVMGLQTSMASMAQRDEAVPDSRMLLSLGESMVVDGSRW